MSRNVKRWMPLIGWVVMIFGLSSVPSLSTDTEFPRGFDKVAHFFEYAVLVILVHRGLSYETGARGVVTFVIVAATCIGVAGLDELYQSFIPGRDSSIMDIVADTSGIALGTVAAVLMVVRLKKKAEKA